MAGKKKPRAVKPGAKLAGQLLAVAREETLVVGAHAGAVKPPRQEYAGRAPVD